MDARREPPNDGPYQITMLASVVSDPQRRGRPVAQTPVQVPATPEGDLARRVRELRVGRKWSQAQLASAMRDRGHDWHQTTVAKTESVERTLRYPEILVLAELLQVPLETLLCLETSADSVARDLNTRLQTLRLDETILSHRLDAVEGTMQDLQRTRTELSSRLAEVRTKIHKVAKAYDRARTK